MGFSFSHVNLSMRTHTDKMPSKNMIGTVSVEINIKKKVYVKKKISYSLATTNRNSGKRGQREKNLRCEDPSTNTFKKENNTFIFYNTVHHH